jgi:hypothetical protein
VLVLVTLELLHFQMVAQELEIRVAVEAEEHIQHMLLQEALAVQES